jgi:hypothetical protein
MEPENTSGRLAIVAISVLILTLGASVWSNMQLRAEIDAIKASLPAPQAQASAAPAPPVRQPPQATQTKSPGRIAATQRRPSRGPGKAPAAPSGANLPDRSELRQAREDEWRASQREQLDTWKARGTLRAQQTVEFLVADGHLDQMLADEALLLLTEELQDTFLLKVDVMEGALSKEDAAAEVDALRDTYSADLMVLVGDEQGREIRRRMRN